MASLVADTLNAGRGLCRPDLVQVLAEESAAAIGFLESFGVRLDVLSQLGGHSAPRTHREANREDGRPRPVGWDIVAALKAHVESLVKVNLVQLALGAQVANLSRTPEGLRVHLARRPGSAAAAATEHVLDADAVIMATGGFSASQELLAKHAPWLEGLPTTNGAWAQGEGLALGLTLGATAEHLDKVQVHPTGFVDPTQVDAHTLFLAPEALRGAGGILLNHRGERFVDELAPRDVVTGAIWRFSALQLDESSAADPAVPLHEQKPVPAEAYLVLDSGAVKRFGDAAFGFYRHAKKFFVEVKGTRGLAEHINRQNVARGYPIEVEELLVRECLNLHAEAAARRVEDAFGKRTFPSSFANAVRFGDEPLYVARIRPVIHYTMGGLSMAANSSLLQADGTVVPGLFGAGEVTGGVHGANRLAGNSLLECVVFGRLAGQHAAHYAVHAAAHQQAVQAAAESHAASHHRGMAEL